MKIDIKGTIIDNDEQWIYDWFGIEATSPKKIADAIAQAKPNEEIIAEINSGGGSVFAGSEIYTTLKSNGNVISEIVGIAGSAASVAAMGAKIIRITPTGQIMIHNAGGSFSGDYRALDKGSEILKNVNISIANAYMLKTGLDHGELLELMNKETWLTPQQALEKKFVDEIMFTNGIKLANNFNGFMLPPEVINKMRNEIKKGLDPKGPKNNIEAEKAKLLMELDLI